MLHVLKVFMFICCTNILLINIAESGAPSSQGPKACNKVKSWWGRGAKSTLYVHYSKYIVVPRYLADGGRKDCAIQNRDPRFTNYCDEGL
jgi:hypothetical protein